MPRNNKLDEEYKEFTKEETKQKKEKVKVDLDKRKKLILKMHLRGLKNDAIYISVVTLFLGFALWSWKPEYFSFQSSLSLGLVWYLLFDDLKLHLMFKQK